MKKLPQGLKIGLLALAILYAGGVVMGKLMGGSWTAAASWPLNMLRRYGVLKTPPTPALFDSAPVDTNIWTRSSQT